MKNKLRRVLDRLSQSSTIAGLGAIGLLVGLPPETINHLGMALIAVAGIAGICLDENGGDQ